MKGCSSRIVPPHITRRRGRYATQWRWRLRCDRELVPCIVVHEANHLFFHDTPGADVANGGLDELLGLQQRHIEPFPANASGGKVLLEAALDPRRDLAPWQPPEAVKPKEHEVARLNRCESMSGIRGDPDFHRHGVFGRYQVEAVKSLLVRKRPKPVRTPHRASFVRRVIARRRTSLNMATKCHPDRAAVSSRNVSTESVYRFRTFLTLRAHDRSRTAVTAWSEPAARSASRR